MASKVLLRVGLAAATAGSVFAAFRQSSFIHADEGPAALDAKEFQKFKITKVEKYNHNTNIYHVAMPKQAPLECSSYVLAKAPFLTADGKPIIKPYTPLDASAGAMQLLVKVYPTGSLSKHFGTLKAGDFVELKGAMKKFDYKPNMKKEIGMLAGGSGITPMLQIINAIISNPEDKTKVTLVFANSTEEDILLREQLSELEKKYENIKVYNIVSKPSGKWRGLSGRINEAVVRRYMPAPSDDNMVFVCGPMDFYKSISGTKAPDYSQGEVAGVLKDLGYTKEQVLKL